MHIFRLIQFNRPGYHWFHIDQLLCADHNQFLPLDILSEVITSCYDNHAQLPRRVVLIKLLHSDGEVSWYP